MDNTTNTNVVLFKPHKSFIIYWRKNVIRSWLLTCEAIFKLKQHFSFVHTHSCLWDVVLPSSHILQESDWLTLCEQPVICWPQGLFHKKPVTQKKILLDITVVLNKCSACLMYICTMGPWPLIFTVVQVNSQSHLFCRLYSLSNIIISFKANLSSALLRV